MASPENSYGLWTLVVLNSAIFIMFAFSFFLSQTPLEIGEPLVHSQHSSLRSSWRCTDSH